MSRVDHRRVLPAPSADRRRLSHRASSRSSWLTSVHSGEVNVPLDKSHIARAIVPLQPAPSDMSFFWPRIRESAGQLASAALIGDAAWRPTGIAAFLWPSWWPMAPTPRPCANRSDRIIVTGSWTRRVCRPGRGRTTHRMAAQQSWRLPALRLRRMASVPPENAGGRWLSTNWSGCDARRARARCRPLRSRFGARSLASGRRFV